MKALGVLKNKARLLRERGLSMNAIASQLRVAKSSVSLWTSDIRLDKKHQKVLLERSRNAGRLAFTRAAHKRARAYRKATSREQKLGRADITSLSPRDIRMIGLGLYWGEGYKRGSRELGFTNSDPGASNFFIRWLRICYGANKSNLSLRVSINSVHREREQEIKGYWLKKLGVGLVQFTKTSFVSVKQKRDYSGRGPHYGTLRIKLRGGSTLRARILASIDSVARKAK